jgi:DNA recombination protein RmuC
MDGILLTLLVFLLIGILGLLYLNLRHKPKDESENREAEEIANLKTEITSLKDTLNTTINTSLGSMSTSFTALSTGVTKDMTEALTKVDEKVANFNSQVELLNKSQEGITKILAGVKKYGTLAEFSLDALIKDLLPASQFQTNVKMKEDTGENVEFAIRLQGDVLVPVDSHFPVEKFKAITDAYDA